MQVTRPHHAATSPPTSGPATNRSSDGIAALPRLCCWAGLLLSIAAIVLIPRGTVQSTKPVAYLLLLGLALAGCCLALALLLTRGIRTAGGQRMLAQIRLHHVVIAAGGLQVAAAIVFHPVQSSDSAIYLGLAHQLANGDAYRDAKGFLAFWPPGLPLYLAPYLALTGSEFRALLFGNLVLYVVSAIALHRLVIGLFDRPVAIASGLLFALWPSRIFLSTFASKETLTTALVLLSLAMATRLADRPTSARQYGVAALLGVSLGLAALAQPGLMLLFCIFPLGFWPRLKQQSLSTLFRLAVVVSLAFAFTAGSWVVRNYVAFGGAFIGIATNGGSVFYRANNDLSGAEYTARGTIDLSSLSELDQNETGFRLGKEWIRSNPTKELLLAARKFAALVDNDSQGVYWALQRGNGSPDQSTATAGERFVADFFNLASYWYWMMLCAGVALACAQALRRGRSDAETFVPLLMPFLYCVVVFSVFESGARQHVFAVPGLIVIAATSVRPLARSFARH